MKDFLLKLLASRKKEAERIEANIKASEDASEVRALGDTLKALSEEIGEVEKQLAELENEGDEGNGGDEGGTEEGGARSVNPLNFYSSTRRTGANALSLGDHYVRNVGQQVRDAVTNRQRFSIGAPEFRAKTDTQVTPALGGDLDGFLVETDPNIVQAYRRPTVASLFTWGSLTKSAIEYFVEGAREGNFETVAQGGAKPQIHYADPTRVVESLVKIAGFIKLSDEMLEDLAFLASEINGRLLYDLTMFEENQLLYGNGTGSNLTGILNRSGLQTLTSAAAADNAETIFMTRKLIANSTGLSADGIVINPTDYEKLRLGKDNNGQYYGGGYFAGQYGNGGMQNDPPLWGINTVVTPAITEKTVLVGNFSPVAATPYRKGGVRVESTNSNEDDFTNNLVTVRAEERIALAVRRPAAFVKVTLA